MGEVQALWLAGTGDPLAGCVPVPSDDGIALCRLSLALLSRGESTFELPFPSRGISLLLDLLGQVGLARRDGTSAAVRGIGLGAEGPSWPGEIDLRGEAAVAAHVLAILSGRQAGLSLRVDRAVGELFGGFLAEQGLVELELGPNEAWVQTVPGAKRSPAFEVGLSGALPWLKQAYLLLGLRALGPCRVSEAFVSADHLERALFRSRAPIEVEPTATTLHPPRDPDALAPSRYEFIGSSYLAGHLLVLPLLNPGGGRVVVRDVSSNRTSTELFSLLRLLGADLQLEPKGDRQGEPIADISLTASGGLARGVQLDGEQSVRLSDQCLPLLAALGSAAGDSEALDLTFARGDSTLRILPRAIGFLRQAGYRAQLDSERVRIGASPTRPSTPVVATTGGEARLALLGALLAVTRGAPSTIDDVACLAHIFPRLAGTLRALGLPARVGGGVSSSKP